MKTNTVLRNKVASVRTSEIDEVEAVLPGAPVIEEVLSAAAPKPAAPKNPLHDMVRISLSVELNPAPRVGHIDMVRDFQMSVMKPGVHTVPRLVAEVLVDKKKATIL